MKASDLLILELMNIKLYIFLLCRSLINSNDGQSYESGILKIHFPDDRPNPPPLFGDTYNFFLEEVVDCPEFVVHFPTVIRLVA